MNVIRSSMFFRFLRPPILLLLLLPLCASGESPTPRVVLENEDLTYNVRYGFVDLGQVRVKILNKQMAGGRPVYFGRARIDSYESVPFVDLHAVYESLIDSAETYSWRFMGKSKDDDFWSFSRYHFDYPRGQVYMEIGEKDTVVRRLDTMEVSGTYQDGLSLFFFARRHLRSGRGMNIPTLIKEEKVNTFIDFENRRTSVEIDVVDYPVDVIEFHGTAEFVGIFGLTGDFEGWFSNDDAHVPILAKMKVIIGSVTIELMDWKRPNWTPPRAQE